MKVLVTGATGFVGPALCLELSRKGHDVVVLARDARKARTQLPLTCPVVEWDLEKSIPPASLFAGVEGVIHLAGESVSKGRWTPELKRAIYDSRILGTRHLVEGLRTVAEGQVKCFISASAVGFYGDRGDELLDESSPGGDQGFLAQTCKDWEFEALHRHIVGARHLAVRTGVVLEKDGGALSKMLPIFYTGAGGKIGSGKQWMSWIHREDLVNLYIFLLEHATATGVVNGVAPNPVTNEDFTRELAKALHRPALLPVPSLALKAIFGRMSSILLDSQRVLPKVAGSLGFSFRHATLSQAFAAIFARPADLAAGEHEFVSQHFVNKTPDETFAFFGDVKNLDRITDPALKFETVSQSTNSLQEGTVLKHRFKKWGLPLAWQSRMEKWIPGKEFVDVQEKGPFAKWQHTHSFEKVGKGTMVTDRVRYRLPLGVSFPLIDHEVARMFAQRRGPVNEVLTKR